MRLRGMLMAVLQHSQLRYQVRAVDHQTRIAQQRMLMSHHHSPVRCAPALRRERIDAFPCHAHLRGHFGRRE